MLTPLDALLSLAPSPLRRAAEAVQQLRHCAPFAPWAAVSALPPSQRDAEFVPMLTLGAHEFRMGLHCEESGDKWMPMKARARRERRTIPSGQVRHGESAAPGVRLALACCFLMHRCIPRACCSRRWRAAS